jgi:hypothetical protein
MDAGLDHGVALNAEIVCVIRVLDQVIIRLKGTFEMVIGG